jgi:hypothetical protein
MLKDKKYEVQKTTNNPLKKPKPATIEIENQPVESRDRKSNKRWSFNTRDKENREKKRRSAVGSG